jgi:hypothetical protein
MISKGVKGNGPGQGVKDALILCLAVSSNKKKFIWQGKNVKAFDMEFWSCSSTNPPQSQEAHLVPYHIIFYFK